MTYFFIYMNLYILGVIGNITHPYLNKYRMFFTFMPLNFLFTLYFFAKEVGFIYKTIKEEKE